MSAGVCRADRQVDLQIGALPAPGQHLCEVEKKRGCCWECSLHKQGLGGAQEAPACSGRKWEKVMRGERAPVSSCSISRVSARLLSAGSFRLSKNSARLVSCEVGMAAGQRHAWKSTMTWAGQTKGF